MNIRNNSISGLQFKTAINDAVNGNVCGVYGTELSEVGTIDSTFDKLCGAILVMLQQGTGRTWNATKQRED